MTKSKWIRLSELLGAAALATATAWYRAHLAEAGQPLIYGGYQYPTTVLLILMAVTVALFFVLSLFGFKAQRPGPEPVKGPYIVAAFLSGLGMMGGAVLYYVECMADPGTLTYVLTVFLALCGLTLVLRTLQGSGGEAARVFSLFPVYYLCLFLLVFYRENSKNPMVLSFGMEIAAVMALTVAVYSLSGRGFGQARPRQQLFFGLLAFYLVCFVVASLLFFPDLVLSVPGVSPAWMLQLAAMGLYVAAGLFLPAAAGPEKGGKRLRNAPAIDIPLEGVGVEAEEAITLSGIVGEMEDEDETPPDEDE